MYFVHISSVFTTFLANVICYSYFLENMITTVDRIFLFFFLIHQLSSTSFSNSSVATGMLTTDCYSFHTNTGRSFEFLKRATCLVLRCMY